MSARECNVTRVFFYFMEFVEGGVLLLNLSYTSPDLKKVI